MASELPPIGPPGAPPAVSLLGTAVGLLAQAEEEFKCSICLGTATDPVCLNPCGHLGCRDCLQQCLDRGPKCPLCKTVTNSETPFVKVHALDNLLGKVVESKEKVEGAKLEVMLRAASFDGGAGDGAITLKGVFKDAIKAAVGAAGGLVTELQAERDEAISKANKSHAAFVAALNAAAAATAGGAGTGAAVLSEKVKAAALERDAAIAQANERYDKGYASLIADTKAYLASVALPPLALMPATVTVAVPSLGVRFDLRVKPTDTIESTVIPAILKAVSEAGGSKVDSLDFSGIGTASGSDGKADGKADGKECAWSLVGPADAAAESTAASLDITAPIFKQCGPSGRPSPGCQILCSGEVKAVSLRATKCLATSWVPGTKEDFFWCKQCSLKWICATCAEACHRSQGHADVVVFLKDHTPTFAACYCHSKNKKACKL